MRYYLGYYNNLEYKPIILEEVSTSILSIVKFTTGFDGLNSLKNHLISEGLIPNNNANLYYLIEKGTKGHKYYERLKTDNIFTLEYSALFTIDGLKKFINENKYNEDMIVLLFGEYLKKFGYDKLIKDIILGKSTDVNQVINFLKELKKAFSEDIQARIDYLLKNISLLSKEDILSNIDYISNHVVFNNIDLINAYLILRKKANFKNIPTIRYLSNWLNIARNHNRIGSEYYTSIPSEYCDIDSEIAIFFNSIVYDYDNDKKEYKKTNGKRKIKERPFFDLAAILASFYKKLYDEYISTLFVSEEEYDEDDEYLCEDDFIRIGTTSEEEGIKIRRINR